MKSSDIFLSAFIVVVFIVCNIVTIIISIMSDIKTNWPKYRCNPLIMPFAMYFGHDPMENFALCISEMQSGMMGLFTNPLDMQMFGMLDVFKSVSGSLDSFRQFSSLLKNTFGLGFLNMFGIFSDLALYFQTLLINVKESIFKILATAAILINIGETVQESGFSFVNGPIYGALKVLSMGTIQ